MKRGFTIAELVVVITLLAFLTTVAIFGANAMMERTKNSEAQSKIATLRSALEKYYAKNNEYPSAASLAGGGDGRNLSAAQYNTIATTLSVSVDVLKNGTYKFVPCANGSSLCCTMSGSNECALTSTDAESRNIYYMTRTATQAASGARLTFKAPPGTSGCTYYFTESSNTQENGYGAYLLMYRSFNDTDWWTTWRVYTSDRGKSWRGDWCAVNKFS